ncbi:hypothetical protein LAJ61_08730 [Moraxella osloensis]|nr:hypothetical protein [Moraxella osloensis]UAY36727.1 hypothetical protein LAJ61_08730 [Moraxella osloensis]
MEVSQWEDLEKSITQVIKELKTFEDQELIVMVSDDGGETFKSVKLLGKDFIDGKPYCVLFV